MTRFGAKAARPAPTAAEPVTRSRTEALRHAERLEQEADRPSTSGLTATAQPPVPRTERQIPGLGRPIPAGLRAGFEAELGAVLDTVRLHDDRAANAHTEALGAEAVTEGEDIAFAGDADPAAVEGVSLLRHELRHVLQQRQPGAAPAVQRQERERDGIGRRPPASDYTATEGVGNEDGHVLFGRDNASLGADDRAALRALVGTPAAPVTVHVHGYASEEGGTTYNENLSAHRAVTVKQFLETLLPEGSTVVAFARGETEAFGAADDNRRVGVDVIETAPTSPVQGLAGPSPDAPSGDTGGSEAEVEADIDFRIPDFGVRLRPPDDPNSFLFRPIPPLPGFDPGGLAPLYSERGLRYPPRDARAAESHFVFWRDRFIQWGGLSPEQAAEAAQIGTEMAFARQLQLEHPTESEALDLRFGTEPTVVPVSDIMIFIYRKATE